MNFPQTLLPKGSSVKVSLELHRLGWIIWCPLSLQQLRIRVHHVAYPVRTLGPEGRLYLAAPTSRFLARRLSFQPPKPPPEFYTPSRSDRLRRLRPFLRVGEETLQTHGVLLRRMAIRLQFLTSRDSQKLWHHMGEDFDTLWSENPLFNLRYTPLQALVLEILTGEHG